jgi:hypothetical protein
MALTFNLREFGHTFATRGRGKEVRDELLTRLAGESAVRLDFEGVTNVSYSFADELLGALVTNDDDGAPVVEFVNMGAPIDRVVRDAVSRRRGEPVAC